MAEKKKPTFEQAMERLNQIVTLLEQGEAPLEEALSLFEEGTGLIKQCDRVLNQAEQRVSKLVVGPGGELMEQPMEEMEP